MSQTRALARAAAELARWERWYHAVSSSFVLARDYLGYDRLTESFHKPIMDEWDERDFSRGLVKAAIREQVSRGVEKGGLPGASLSLLRGGRDYDKGELFMAGRDHYKTTMMIARCVRLHLVWRDCAIGGWHCVEEEIQKTCDEIANHWLYNDLLRGLRPGIVPSKNQKQFVSKTGTLQQFILENPKSKRAYHRWPSCRAKGACSEVTGGHPDVGWLDDIIAQKTIDDSEMPKVRRWLGNTLSNVVRTDGGFVWITGTHWDDDDVYEDIQKNPMFDCMIRGAVEDSGVPVDEDILESTRGEPVLYTKKELMRKRRAPGMTRAIWMRQMQNIQVPASERRWDRSAEAGMWTSWSDIRDVPGRVIVFSDPAPKGISLRGEKDKQRGEAGGDYWSIAVMKLFVEGDFQYAALVYGCRSREWGLRQGFDECVRLMSRYGCKHFFNESYSGTSWFNEFRVAARAIGVRHVRSKDGGPLRYKDTHAANQKNLRFEAFCDRAREGDFLICEDTCPAEFLYGDGEKTGVLTQARKWMPLQRGRNNLSYDDDMDCVSRFTDSGVQAYVDRPLFENTAVNSPLWVRKQDHEPEYTWGTRHVRV